MKHDLEIARLVILPSAAENMTVLSRLLPALILKENKYSNQIMFI
jgi:hypothetical protein